MADRDQGLRHAWAEEFIWAYFEKRLASEGQSESARYLRHFLNLKLQDTQTESEWTTFRFDLQHRVSDCLVKLNANDGSVMGWYFELLAQGSEAVLAPEEAIAIAESVVRPPKNAVLDTAGYEAIGGQQVFLAHWRHEAKGVPVERDFIQVMVNGKTGKVFAFFKRWHKIDYEYSER